MTRTPRPAWPTRAPGPPRRVVPQPVLAILLAALLSALLWLPFLTVAPNRLVTGHGVALRTLLTGPGWWGLAPAAVLAGVVMVRRHRALDIAAAAAAAALVLGLVALAGATATRLLALGPALTRVSLGGGFWLAVLLAWAAYADALRRADPGARWRRFADGVLLLSLALLLRAGLLDALSLVKEYEARQDVFQAALWRHLQIVGVTLTTALLAGLPVGYAAARRPGVGRPVLATLSLIQTLPSIALFGLLIGPLAWLGRAWPGSGLQGTGLLPAVVVLTAYALLPIVHGVLAGLRQVPAAALEAAAGMGMSPRQRFVQVELPLALPVLLSALRLTAVQLVGLAVVAALIGAGGLGAIIFQGLFSNALDMVLLGVLPVVALALVVDHVLRLPAPVGAERAS